MVEPVSNSIILNYVCITCSQYLLQVVGDLKSPHVNSSVADMFQPGLTLEPLPPTTSTPISSLSNPPTSWQKPAPIPGSLKTTTAQTQKPSLAKSRIPCRDHTLQSSASTQTSPSKVVQPKTVTIGKSLTQTTVRRHGQQSGSHYPMVNINTTALVRHSMTQTPNPPPQGIIYLLLCFCVI